VCNVTFYFNILAPVVCERKTPTPHTHPHFRYKTVLVTTCLDGIYVFCISECRVTI